MSSASSDIASRSPSGRPWNEYGARPCARQDREREKLPAITGTCYPSLPFEIPTHGQRRDERPSGNGPDGSPARETRGPAPGTPRPRRGDSPHGSVRPVRPAHPAAAEETEAAPQGPDRADRGHPHARHHRLTPPCAGGPAGYSARAFAARAEAA